jgi:hypothetical protein
MAGGLAGVEHEKRKAERLAGAATGAGTSTAA